MNRGINPRSRSYLDIKEEVDEDLSGHRKQCLVERIKRRRGEDGEPASMVT